MFNYGGDYYICTYVANGRVMSVGTKAEFERQPRAETFCSVGSEAKGESLETEMSLWKRLLFPGNRFLAQNQVSGGK
jgi:hypothetical protein